MPRKRLRLRRRPAKNGRTTQSGTGASKSSTSAPPRRCKDKESTEKAEKLANDLIKHPLANYKIQAMMEKNFILEDTQRYRVAYVQWKKFREMPALAANSGDKGVQEISFPAYFYLVRNYYKIGILDPVTKDKDRQKFIDGAANMILKLEYANTKDGWEIAGPMFYDFFKEKDSEKLKKSYDAQKALKLKKSSLSVPPREFAAICETAEFVGWVERSEAHHALAIARVPHFVRLTLRLTKHQKCCPKGFRYVESFVPRCLAVHDRGNFGTGRHHLYPRAGQGDRDGEIRRCEERRHHRCKEEKGRNRPRADVLEIVYDNISPASLSLLGGAYRAAKDAEKAAETDDPAAQEGPDRRDRQLQADAQGHEDAIPRPSKTSHATWSTRWPP